MAQTDNKILGNILVVDDEADIALLVELIISSSGFAVESCNSAHEALEILPKKDFDLIILDVQMPEMSGFELCKKHLKVNKKTRDIPVLFLSAVYTDTNNIVAGLELGALDFLSKPFDNQVLLEKVRNLVKLKKMADDLRETNEKLNKELKLVETLQKKFLSKELKIIDNLRFDTYYRASSFASGDYFEAYPLEDGRQMFLLADVSGHGAVAAVIMAVARAVTLLKIEEKISGVEALKCLHDTLRKLVPSSFYLTMFYGMYCPEKMELEYISAGHCPVLFYEKKEGQFHQVNGTCPPVGLGPGIFKAGKRATNPGDILFLFTDGITETKNVQNRKEQYGIERVRDTLLTELSGEEVPTLENLREKLIENLITYNGSKDFTDDITTFFIGF
ncbi:SpoIIE family protein phosphatase [Candidatus Riflebacteria bacterium]